LGWAGQLLQDFDEVDVYLADARHLYSCVDAAYAMSKWSPDGTPLTASQEEYLKFWSKMGAWYEAFRQHLRSKNMLTSGMAYRMLAENIEEYAAEMHWDKLLVCGFNALNNAEIRWFKHLEKSGKAVFLWDTDTYYLDDPIHEAGHFFRRIKKEWTNSPFQQAETRIDSDEKEIHVLGMANNMAQALAAGTLLQQWSGADENLEHTALVLCDERLLMPVLEIIPANIDSVNVTLGYPLHQLPILGLYQLVFEMQRKAKFSQSTRNSAFYFRDLQKIFRHPGIHHLIGSEAAQTVVDFINQKARNYISGSTLTGLHPQINALTYVFEAWNGSMERAWDVLLRLTEHLRQHYAQNPENDGYNSETLQQIRMLFNRISDWSQQFPDVLTMSTVQRVFTQLSKQMQLPFYGEPLTGLQVMGLLETRNIDFKRLIVLSVNEGVLPAGRSNRSFIPADIAKSFGLPSYAERDAIYAYHFYRMLQIPQEVWLFYTTVGDELGKGEQSRFITQIQQEFKKARIYKHLHVASAQTSDSAPIAIAKTPEIIQKMINRYRPDESRTGISPSALQRYVNCSFSFYMHYLSGIEIKEDREEDLEFKSIGNICHQTLENLFKPYEGQILNSEHYDTLISKLPAELQSCFCAELGIEHIETGKYKVKYHILERMLYRYLKIEQQEDEGYEIIELEKKLRMLVSVSGADGPVTVQLGGKADRIDRCGGVVRIIDYKTGAVKDNELKPSSLAEVVADPSNAKLLQLLYYRMLWNESFPNDAVMPGIIPLKKPSEGIQTVNTSQLSDEERDLPHVQLKQMFTGLVEELFNPEIPFIQTDDIARCNYCSFKGVCSRNS
jgi:ATP-dependent helicase/nuclease subunit B